MNVASWLLWGFVGTVVLTTLMASSQGLGLTRMNLPYMLGTIFTPSRDRAKVYGFLFQVFNGWVFSLLYVAAFHALETATWWFGGLIGAVHAAFVLTAGMRIVPGMHPRMANEQRGPTVTRQLEPPGFLALNYGVATPVSSFVAHIVFGIILGAFYALPGVRGEHDGGRPAPALPPLAEVQLNVGVDGDGNEALSDASHGLGIAVRVLVHPPARRAALDAHVDEDQPLLAARAVEHGRPPRLPLDLRPRRGRRAGGPGRGAA